MKKRIFLAVVFLFVFFSRAGAGQLEVLFRKGQKAYSQGRMDEAIADFEKVVDMNENFAPVYNALGLARDRAGSRLSEVVWCFKVATDIDPSYAEAYSNLCRVYYQAGQFDNAEKACLDALKINPSMGSAQLSLAWVYLAGKQQPFDAINYFRKVLERVKNPTVYFGLGMAYSMAGDHARVLEIITTLRDIGANDLANQLEDAIRGKEIPPPRKEATPSSASLPERQKGLLIESHPQPTPEPVSEKAPAPISGQMQIRLKGRLFDSGTK